jgi:hypothetical protein
MGGAALYYNGVLGSKERYWMVFGYCFSTAARFLPGNCSDHRCHLREDMAVRRFEISFVCIGISIESLITMREYDHVVALLARYAISKDFESPNATEALSIH